MRKLSERQVNVLRALASGSILICHHTPGCHDDPGGWRVEGLAKIPSVLGATANGLFDRGFLRYAGRDGGSNLYEISDAGRTALASI